ncbi:hydrogenase maturation nickel metallochaperone HypA/HybF [Corynebacterium freneyi]|uniref:Hydrogenase maturation factor HypA n=1 Tax=Corynebacterium freneyi DNF00450 TaxID=1287475 RepID=A0A095Y6J1_9CORY|nr:hydrogenase maturation nickel metallochaperone HypA [Corynebacterium freneyi]KGF18065.1 hydrogenase expression protein HupH [Corynebacterium freneyi DNF00450]
MHELGLLTGVVEVIVDAADGRRVRRVALDVGTRSGVIEDALHAAWPLATGGTVCAGADLEIDIIPATVWCPACAAEHEIDEFFALACPACGAPTADLRHGREFAIREVDVDAGTDTGTGTGT